MQRDPICNHPVTTLIKLRQNIIKPRMQYLNVYDMPDAYGEFIDRVDTF